MKLALGEISWPIERAGEVIEALAGCTSMPLRPVNTPRLPAELDHADAEALEIWMEQSAKWLGLEIEATACAYPDIDTLLLGAGPAIIRVSDGRRLGLLALVRARRGKVTLLGPDLRRRRFSVAAVRSLIANLAEARVRDEVEEVLDQARVSPRRRQRAHAALLAEMLRGEQISGCWMLRLPPETPFSAQLGYHHLPRRLALLIATHALQYGLWILSFWAIGRGALRGQIDPGWLAAWVILLVSLVPLRMLTSWWAGRVAIDAGALIKQRLMAGALRSDPDELRSQGVGQLLGRVLESEAVESMALSGGFLTLFALVELIMAAVVLGAGAGGWIHVLMLIAWAVTTVAIAGAYLRRRRLWTKRRLVMTHGLVERMVGHATRLAQQPRARWHDGEDDELARYVDESREMDRGMVIMTALVPRGWLMIGIIGLLPAFVSHDVVMAPMAIALGGVLLAYRAFRQMVEGLAHLGSALLSWEEVAPVFAAATRREVIGPPALAGEARATDDAPVVAVHDLLYHHQHRAEPVLHGCELEIRTGDRLLIEGLSGSGKSTLGALIAGVREPESGLLLVGGLDRHTLGAAGWRQQVACAAQFHENYVFSGTLAFNLLMGRRWPPPERDLGEAERLCRELGLGDVIDRMPGGMLQMVGETGWQLSHGERGRVFIARALLQGSAVVVLDESFAGLDPENQVSTLDTVLTHAQTLVVIAHP